MLDLPDLGSVTADHFEPVKGQAFEARPPAAGEPFTVVLAGIRRRSGPPGFREPFSLEFLCPWRVATPPAHGQGVYRLSHPQLGDLDVFLVPVGASDAGVAYEVSFG
jgi:hypothetical protein